MMRFYTEDQFDRAMAQARILPPIRDNVKNRLQLMRPYLSSDESFTSEDFARYLKGEGSSTSEEIDRPEKASSEDVYKESDIILGLVNHLDSLVLAREILEGIRSVRDAHGGWSVLKVTDVGEEHFGKIVRLPSTVVLHEGILTDRGVVLLPDPDKDTHFLIIGGKIHFVHRDDYIQIDLGKEKT